MKDKLTVDEINAALQAAAVRDAEDVVEDPVAYAIAGEPDTEGWDEFVERVIVEGPPVDEEGV